MWHEKEDLVEEQQRTRSRPRLTPEVPLLDALNVVPVIDLEEYARNLRSVLGAALHIAATEPFEGQLPTVDLPEWFVRASAVESTDIPDFARLGGENYRQHPGIDDGPWEIQDWLHRFEPEDGIRGWAWWDLTRPTAGGARIWINCEGEAHYPHLDLLWVAYVSGAHSVSYPEAHQAQEWAAEVSLAG